MFGGQVGESEFDVNGDIIFCTRKKKKSRKSVWGGVRKRFANRGRVKPLEDGKRREDKG